MSDTDRVEAPTFEENRQAGIAIAQKGGAKAVGMVIAFMQKNAEDQYNLERSLYESMEKDRDKWKARCLEAENELFVIQRRVCGLVGVDLGGWPEP